MRGAHAVRGRRRPGRHEAPPDPIWREIATASKGFLVIISLAVFLLNLAESGVQEMIGPGTTPGFFRLSREGPGVYRLMVAGVAHDVNTSSLKAMTRRALQGIHGRG